MLEYFSLPPKIFPLYVQHEFSFAPPPYWCTHPCALRVTLGGKSYGYAHEKSTEEQPPAETAPQMNAQCQLEKSSWESIFRGLSDFTWKINSPSFHKGWKQKIPTICIFRNKKNCVLANEQEKGFSSVKRNNQKIPLFAYKFSQFIAIEFSQWVL